MRLRPKPPTSEDINSYKHKQSCGIYTAKERLRAQYDAALLAWLVEAVELLLEERATNSVEGQP